MKRNRMFRKIFIIVTIATAIVLITRLLLIWDSSIVEYPTEITGIIEEPKVNDALRGPFIELLYGNNGRWQETFENLDSILNAEPNSDTASASMTADEWEFSIPIREEFEKIAYTGGYPMTYRSMEDPILSYYRVRILFSLYLNRAEFLKHSGEPYLDPISHLGNFMHHYWESAYSFVDVVVYRTLLELLLERVEPQDIQQLPVLLGVIQSWKTEWPSKLANGMRIDSIVTTKEVIAHVDSPAEKREDLFFGEDWRGIVYSRFLFKKNVTLNKGWEFTNEYAEIIGNRQWDELSKMHAITNGGLSAGGWLNAGGNALLSIAFPNMEEYVREHIEFEKMLDELESQFDSINTAEKTG